MAIFVILLLTSIPLGIVQASESLEKNENKKTVSIEITTLNSDEILETETISLTEDDLVIFKETIETLIDRIQSAESWEEVQSIVNNVLNGNNLGIFSLIKLLFSKLISGRTYIISSGHGYRFNPFKKGSMKIRKTLSIWHYSSGKILKDRTIFIKPLALKMRVLKGSQFGIMTRFTGLFIYTARKFPQKSHTFFIGIARRVNGIQMPFAK